MKIKSQLTKVTRSTLPIAALGLLFASIGHASAPAGRYSITGGAIATVADNQTGLIWQQLIDGKGYNYVGAKSYCAQLLGGAWRLPSPKELQTLIDESVTSPAIDQTAFPNTPSIPGSWFWTLQPVEGASLGWAVRFQEGLTTTAGTDSLFFVRCVR